MKKHIILLAGVLMSSSALTQADTLADWTFETSAPTTPGPLSPESGTETATAQASASGLNVISSPAGNGSTHSFSANGWNVGSYFQFAVNTVGYQDITISYDQTGSGTGPADFTFEYSTDGGQSFATDGSYTVSLSNWSAATAHTGFTFSYDLSSISALDNDASVIFRVVDANNTTDITGTAAVGAAGTDRMDNVIVNGTVAPVPEPSSIALAAIGGFAGLMVLRRKR